MSCVLAVKPEKGAVENAHGTRFMVPQMGHIPMLPMARLTEAHRLPTVTRRRRGMGVG
jgi:hypothetical protein